MKLRTADERFWAKVRKTKGCWNWIGARTSAGYGELSIGSKTNGTAHMVYAHRYSWERTFARIPAAMRVLHHCDNPACVRTELDPNHPDWKTGHLFLGTQRDNMRDMAAKNRDGTTRHPESVARGDRHWSRLYPERRPRGEKHGSRTHPEALPRGEGHTNAKLTEEKVNGIRELYANKGFLMRELADKFGVSLPTISDVVRRRTWRHL